MPSYTITRELQSAAFFPVPFVVSGYTFMTPGGRESGIACASGVAAGDEFRAALLQWENGLRVVLDSFAVTALVALSSYGGSVLVEKKDTTVAWFMRWDVRRDVVTITDDTTYLTGGISDVVAQLGSGGPVSTATRHYRESLLYPSTLVATIHLLRALEAISGKAAYTSKCQRCGLDLLCESCSQPASWPRTNHDRLEELLGTPTYRYFYKTPSVRNLLMHGEYVDQTALEKRTPILRAAVQDELRARVQLAGKPYLDRARGPQAYRSYRMWIDKAGQPVSLADLIDMHFNEQLDFISSPRILMPEEVEALGPAW